MAGFSAYGTILRIDMAGAGNAVAELTNISGPSVSVDTIDVSTHDSWRHGAVVGAVTFTNGTNVVNRVGHGLVNGNVISFQLGVGGALPAELSLNRWYYVINRAADTFQVSLTPGGAIVTFTDDGSATVNAHRAGAFREFVAGLIDAGEISFEGNLIDVTQSDEIMDAIVDRDVLEFEIEFPEGEEWSFDGIVTGFEVSAPHDGKIGFSASVKVTGEPELV